MSKLISKIVVPDSNEATGYALYNVKDANAIPASEKGVASGVATLDNTGKIPSSQIPSSIVSLLSDWNQTDSTAGDYIKNKPTIPSVGNAEIEIQKNGTKVGSFTTNQSGSKVTMNITVPTGTAANKDVPTSGNASTSQVVMGNDSRLTDSRNAKDVYSWAKASSKPTYTASEVKAIPTSAKGAASGVATLDSAGKVPASQLPSYVDDVLEYNNKASFPTTGETGKIYIDKATNLTWRWGGSAYVEISPSLALGETSSTAYAGDKGKALADKLATIAEGAEVNVQSDWNATSGDAFIKNKPTIPSEVMESTVSGWGFTKNAGTITGIKMNGSSKGTSGTVDLGTVITAHQDISGKVDKTTTVNGHALSSNVSVTKSDVGLGNVGNFKAVSTVASQGLTDTEKSNARANIGAGTSSFSGSYNDLSNKPTIPAAAANGKYTVKTLVGSTTTNVSDFTANQSSADDVTFVQGSNVTITPDATNRKITIAATNTKNTAGTTNKTDTKMFLAAATSQAANPQTYSNSNCYIGTDNCLYSGGTKVLTSHQSLSNYYTKTQVDALTRHTRLTDFDLNVLKQAVADGNLEKYGLKVGDQKTINGHTYVIAGLNPMKGTSTPHRVTANHVGLIVIPHTTTKWNASGNTSTGADGRGAGYKNSDLHYYLKNTVLPMCNTDLGADNLIGHSKLLSNAVNTSGYNKFGLASGCASGWAWEENCKIAALSEVQVYGAAVWSSSGYDTGEACRQLDVFQRYSHTDIFGGEYPWLRDVASTTHAAFADNYGDANYNTASTAYYVAGLILFH